MVKIHDHTDNKSNSVLFILGNGFDLGLGMKTSYSHIYDSYINTPSKSAVVMKFKMDLANREPYDKWSDFEMGMAEYAKTLFSEEELIECVRDFKRYMVEHLKKENERISDDFDNRYYWDTVINDFNESKEAFYNGLTRNVQNQIQEILKDGFVEYNYITFNYTKVLETIMTIQQRKNKVVDNEPIHIHGDIDNDVVVGIDNIDQLKGTVYKISRRGQRAFVKPKFNDEYDRARVTKAKKLISDSSVICTYGFSMGDSDKMWIDILLDWLQKDPNHHLVVYQYDETEYGRYNYDEIMDVEDEKKTALLKKMGVQNEALFDQIHIPVGHDIFNFEVINKKSGNQLAVSIG